MEEETDRQYLKQRCRNIDIMERVVMYFSAHRVKVNGTLRLFPSASKLKYVVPYHHVHCTPSWRDTALTNVSSVSVNMDTEWDGKKPKMWKLVM
jgi:hypothetical protein